MDRTKTLNKLLHLCKENQILQSSELKRGELENVDLIENGFIDSISLFYMQDALEEEFQLEIPTKNFFAELRTLNKIAEYIEQRQYA